MSTTKEANLLLATMNYATRCLQEGDNQALSKIGFTPEMVDKLRHLTVSELIDIAARPQHFMSVKIDQTLLDSVVSFAQNERNQDDVFDRLIRADAPLSMMRHYTPFTNNDYASRRRLAGMLPVRGRPAEPDEQTYLKVCNAVKDMLGDRHPNDLQAIEFLEVHERTGLSLRLIWSMAQHWVDYGIERHPLELVQDNGEHRALRD